jgi:hypothetical protein
MALFAEMSSTTTCLMVRLFSGAGFSTFAAADWTFVFHGNSPEPLRSRLIAAPRALICRELSAKPRTKLE